MTAAPFEGLRTFVSAGTYNISTDEPEAQYLTREMLDSYIHAIRSATSSVEARTTIRSPFVSDYQRQEEVWPSFEPHDYWTPVSEMRVEPTPEEPPFPTGRRAWEDVERPVVTRGPVKIYPPIPEAEEGPGIETISMIGFK